jgi:DNA-binding PadR family transcriptional regulator
MSDTKPVRAINPRGLPPELTKNLKSVKTGDTYTFIDLCLAFIAHHGEATLDDLLIYIYEIRNKITSRGYMYQMMHRLRRDELVRPVEKAGPHTVVYKLTVKGEELALPYLQPESGEVA